MAETIVIREQSEQQGPRGPFLKIIAPDNEWYFVWDAKLFASVKGRSSIIAEVDRSTKFKRITAVIPDHHGSPPNQAPLPEPTTNGRWSNETKDEQIARAVALKAAVDHWSEYFGKATLDHTQEQIANWTLKLADLYLAWLQGPPF